MTASPKDVKRMLEFVQLDYNRVSISMISYDKFFAFSWICNHSHIRINGLWTRCDLPSGRMLCEFLVLKPGDRFTPEDVRDEWDVPPISVNFKVTVRSIFVFQSVFDSLSISTRLKLLIASPCKLRNPLKKSGSILRALFTR